jgi:Fe-S-cluster-containing hydrogenase component 2
MKTLRKIIEIDEELCTGCGQCILACAEGALELRDGKARVIGELLCDGLGACLGQCPEGALTIVEREADAFDEQAVEEHLAKTKKDEPAGKKPAAHPPMCPSLAFRSSADPADLSAETRANIDALGAGQKAGTPAHSTWPLKLQLTSPDNPKLDNTDLLLVGDCAGFAAPDVMQSKALSGSYLTIACPKFEDHESQVARLSEILTKRKINSITVVIMEVPCCGGLLFAAQKARDNTGSKVPIKRMKVDRTGNILEYEDVPQSAA